VKLRGDGIIGRLKISRSLLANNSNEHSPVLVKRIRLQSSAIEAVTYDDRMCTLVVKFREGESYRYFNVPEVVYQELLKADSVGAFWNGVKDYYRYERLD